MNVSASLLLVYRVSVAIQHTVRAGAGASVGVVTELMDVHASLGIGIVAGDVPRDGGRSGLGGLLKDHLSSDLRVSSNDSNWREEWMSARWPCLGQSQANGGIFRSRCCRSLRHQWVCMNDVSCRPIDADKNREKASTEMMWLKGEFGKSNGLTSFDHFDGLVMIDCTGTTMLRQLRGG